MNTFEGSLKQVTNEIEKQLGHSLDLVNETYVLQTPSAYIKIGIEDDDNGKETIGVHVTGGKLTYLETNNDIFNELYESEDE